MAAGLGQSLAQRVRQIAFGLIVIAAGLGPLAPTIEATLVLRLIIQALFVLAGTLWVLSMAMEGRIRLRRSGLGVWLGLLALAVLTATLNASYEYPAILSAFVWLSSMVAFLFVLNEARSRRRQLLLLGAIGASAFVVSLHGLHQIVAELPRARALFAVDPAGLLESLNLPQEVAYDFEGRLGKDRIFATFLLPNSLAGFLVIVLPAYLGMFLDRLAGRRLGESRVPVLYSALLFCPAFLALYFTKSKGGWLAFLASLVLFAVWAFAKLLWRRRMQTLCAILCLLIVGVISQASGLLTPLRDYGGSFAVRYGYWRSGLVIIEKHPALGVGLDNFMDYYSAFKRSEDQEARRAHNDYVQIAAEMGLIGFLLYALFWLRFWRRVWEAEDATGPPPTEGPEADLGGPAIGILASLIIFGLGVFCGGVFRTSEGWAGWTWPIILWLGWLAFLLWTTRRDDSDRPAPTHYTTIGIGCGLAAFLAHSFVDFDHYVGGILQTAWIMMALLLAARLNRGAEVYAVDRKIGPAWRFTAAMAAICVSLVLLYGVVAPIAESHVRQERAVDRTNSLSNDARRAELLLAAQRNPWNAHTHALLSDVLLAMWSRGRETTRQGTPAFAEAITHAREAVRLNPMRSEYHARLGRLYERQWLDNQIPADYDKALAAYQRAAELFPTRPDSPLHLGRLHDLAGRYDVALGKYFRARALSEEQYHISRKFSSPELQELNARIGLLKSANTTGESPPPLAFTQPRLLGWPGYLLAGPRSGAPSRQE